MWQARSLARTGLVLVAVVGSHTALLAAESDADAAAVRLGGLGTGWVTVRADGAFGAARLSPLAPVVSSAGRGTLAALWTEAAGRTTAHLLGAQAVADAPVLAVRRAEPRFPAMEIAYQDGALPVSVRFKAYGAVQPFDVAASSVPAVVLSYRLRNAVRAPVRASLVISWACLLGKGYPAMQRQSVPEIRRLPTADGYTGIACTGLGLADVPVADLRTHNTRGSQCLLVALPEVGAEAFTSVWDASAPAPPWWKRFASDGSLTMPSTATTAADSASMAVAVRFELGANEEREVAFALAWHTPRLYDTAGRCWQPAYVRRYANAERVALDILEDRRRFETLGEEWQRHFVGTESLRAWLPRLSAELEDAAAHAFLAFPEQDKLRTRLISRLVETYPSDEPLECRKRIHIQHCLLALFPRLDGDDLAQRLNDSSRWPSVSSEVAQLIRMAATRALWAGGRDWLAGVWPQVKALGERMSASSSGSDGEAADVWRDLLDMATLADDAEFARKCLSNLSRSRDTGNRPRVDSAWCTWFENLGCRWDARTQQLAIHPTSMPQGRALRGTVFGGEYVATIEARFGEEQSEFDYRLDRLVQSSPGHGTAQQVPDASTSVGQSVGELSVVLPVPVDPRSVVVAVRRRPVGVASFRRDGSVLSITLEGPVVLSAGDRLHVTIQHAQLHESKPQASGEQANRE